MLGLARTAAGRTGPVMRLASPRMPGLLRLRGFASVRKDPEEATGLYYHALPGEEGVWALSLLSTPPASASAASVLGILRTRDGEEPAEYLRKNPDEMRRNDAFWDVLHRVLQAQVPDDEPLQVEAMNRGNGWAHMCDARNEAAPGRVASPDDIFGSVAFSEGKLDASTYERNDTYRFCVKPEGPMQLPRHWLDSIRKQLASS
ncbi:unnamed protein product [Malassezia sympodialis ATCC 42132]|uniref:Uncharacterized protein n=1 Tax=Malassezia sympodialis (strain ATCC 42132) TaxID=1230383 RepID=M5ED03_MALS4|nr:uncharacterized protein MSY001_2936 [Malassezia sympodialis ATCC 42132]CCV00231.1 unnamed protein product [Malassezia sympodialis ATCC 42132]SHO78844.1 Uncharacterized protein MSYG_3192 [Malassezia sympodialis ATCC 42132]|eukprot:XP_018741437.1 uncharacterized protein MSY001_2936 [Malassezia sympodialis ATCC 42132]